MNKIIRVFFINFKDGFKDFGHLMAFIVNYVLLFFVYIVGVGLTSIIAKSFKRVFLNIKKKRDAKSYWEDLNLKRKKMIEYYRQF
ncbi:hypothetical protein J4214_05530 [Candidatus Woesearchaeota archaeon]|nr:hypothetical protein [Candidatus Woesearchaeota archaeon]